MAYPLYPDNPFAKIVTLKYFDPSDGKVKPYNTASLSAFIAAVASANEIPTAAPADDSLLVSCTFITGSKGKYAVRFGADLLTYTLLNGLFGGGVVNTPYLIIRENSSLRGAIALEYIAAKPIEVDD